MKVHNLLPCFHSCMLKWVKKPSLEDFLSHYFNPFSQQLGEIFDGPDFYTVLEGLNWEFYRTEVLRLDPIREEVRLRKHLKSVEALLGFSASGEVVLFGAFAYMDGYARFDKGTHKVFLGVDESHGRGMYLDILEVHELVHVVRESRKEVWEGFGLNLQMSHQEFTDSLPVIEHLFGEGFSCAISELLVPGEDPCHYVYQTQASLKRILERGAIVDLRVKQELRSPQGDYGRLYQTSGYGVQMPQYTHYVWAWQWVKKLIKQRDPEQNLKNFVTRCSLEFMKDALNFKLTRIE